MSGKCPFSFLSRRSFLKSAGGGLGYLAAASGVGLVGTKIAQAAAEMDSAPKPDLTSEVPFWGHHQAGIVTPQQNHTYFVALDLTTGKREDVIQLLKEWTAASEKLTQGKSIEVPVKKAAAKKDQDDTSYTSQSTADSGEAQGLKASRLTLTFGFGASLFRTKDGIDRYHLASHKPEALVDLPKFHGDELMDSHSGGDLSIQACANDPQVAFHAVRQLLRYASTVAQVRWAQIGFNSPGDPDETPRNLMGFKDGTQQPMSTEHDKVVWVNEGPAWMRGGSYLVARKIRIALEHWDGTEVEFQEQVIGRKKDSGAPLGQKRENDIKDLKALDKDGNLIIAENAHIRLASAEANGGAQILRRGYSYNDGVNMTAERWPPWRQGMEYDAGLFFLGYQADPRASFIKIFGNIAKIDALNQFTTHVGSGVFACPPGVKKGEYLGQKLFEKA